MSIQQQKRKREEGPSGSQAVAAAAAGSGAVMRPELFYMPRESMVATADAFVVPTGGCKLAVHSQILQLASPVLEEAFTAQREGAAATSSLEVSAPFSDYTFEEALLWLQLAYSPEISISAAHLAPCSALLPGVVRLSHALQAQKLVVNLCHLATQTDLVTVPQLVELIEIADACHLDDAKSAGLARLCSLFRQPWQLQPEDGRAIATQLGRESLATVLASTISGMRTGSFSCSFSACSVYGLDMDRAASPVHPCVGLQWQLKVQKSKPSSSSYDVTHLAVCLVCASSPCPPLRAKFTVSLAAERPANNHAHTYTHTFSPDNSSGGSEQFISIKKATDRTLGFVASKRLHFTVDVTLL